MLDACSLHYYAYYMHRCASHLMNVIYALIKCWIFTACITVISVMENKVTFMKVVL